MPHALAARLAKTAPVVIGSVLLHVSIALALVATSGGHARAGITLPVATLDVAQIDAPTLEPVAEEAPPPLQPRNADHGAAVPAHTHAYPVAPSHEAYPHDPALQHPSPYEPVTPATANDLAHDAEPAQAPPVEVAASSAAALPRFSIPSGAGLPAGGHVSASAAGSGGGTVPAAGGGGDDVAVAASAVQVSARLVQSVVAAYPSGARADDVEGDVGVEIVVDREGRVVEARVVRPAGNGFDDAALTAIRRYRFTPAQREGNPVRVRMPWSVQFRLR
jgi:periplasmic protein TonB